MNAEYFRTMFGYSSWAWGRVLDQVVQLSQDDYVAARPLDYGNIRGTMVHALGAEARYLAIWKDEPVGARPDEITAPTIAELRTWWSTHQQDMIAFLAALTDEACQREIKQVSGRTGLETVTPQWVLMAQVVNHHTQHRSEVALQISQLGHSPGDLDVTQYFRERAG
jgi:uncharacterized damage-inducible protein DinB